ncbi:hypothetical protein VRRI112168_16695 [Vreelandella rituensis]|uniref:Thioredoxin domain-containing protein n=1 Tax=Vreelandella rituensis TaxID=2282306 RepID=A0A368U0S2_9GAMM|nr:hypothetical protein [Halomonas rituensis]RCV90719.1 hypothetical protein DU506_11380 [Halomonas rituensis]
MKKLSKAGRQKFKLVLLISVFLLPMVAAWGMVEWRLGIPEQRTAHGTLNPEIPPLSDWPLEGVAYSKTQESVPEEMALEKIALESTAPETPEENSPETWILAFDCQADCAAQADQWWRLHRALGREAVRVSRLRIGGAFEALPGEKVRDWQARPGWVKEGDIWILDPQGHPVLAFNGGTQAADVLKDIKHLLRVNPDY